MAIPTATPVPVRFNDDFESMDMPDASSAEFSTWQGLTKWCLIELPKEDLATLEAGTPYYFRSHIAGPGSSVATLCTDKATYELEFLENSNSLLLAEVSGHDAQPAGSAEAASPPAEGGAGESAGVAAGDAAKEGAKLDLKCSVFAQCRGHIFLKPAFGDAQQVRNMLQPHDLGREAREAAREREAPAPQPGEEERERPVLEPVTTGSLSFEVAASPAELRSLLEDGPYVEHSGRWHWMPSALEREVLDGALSIVVAKGADQSRVDAAELLRAVQEFMGDGGQATVPSTEVLRKALRSVLAAAPAPPAAAAPAEGADPPSEAPAEAALPPADPALSTTHFCLDAAKVKEFFALQLLRDPPSQVREKFQLPPPAPRTKRARLGGGGVGGGRDQPLSLDEFTSAYKDSLNDDTLTTAKIEDILGDRAYVDVFDDTIHPMDASALPQDPKLRLRRLFELQTHWRPERMSALMKPALPGLKVDKWLMAFTRTAFIEVEKGVETRTLIKKFAGLG